MGIPSGRATRVAEVFVDRDAEGRPIVRKVFAGPGPGAPGRWCEAAVRAACARRRILARLAAHWFGDRLRLPRTLGCGWSPEHRAFELRCELIDGCGAPGDPRASAGAGDPADDLARRVLVPLRRHLQEAGFGALARRGRPSARDFLLERPRPGDAPGHHRWVWVDLEPEVPERPVRGPLADLGSRLLGFLRPAPWGHDRVDVLDLRRYLRRHRADVERTIGPQALGEVQLEVVELDLRQQEQRAIPRLRRSVAGEARRGWITATEAAASGRGRSRN